MELVIGSRVTAEAVSECAHRHRRVVLPEVVLERVGGVHDAARTIAERQPVYGRTTGVGANKDTVVADAGGHGARLLRSHAVAAGPPLPREHVRAMLVVRLQQLAQARSGIDPAVLTGLHALLDGDCLPGVRTWGGVGTGDLPALAAVGLALMGERPTSPTWPGPPLVLSGESALPLISSSALTTGRTALGVVELERLARTSEVVFGLTAHAAGANPQHWSPTAARAAAHPGTEEVAARLSALLGAGKGGRRIQDRYGFRAFVHAQGVLADRLSRLRGQVEALVNAGQENPLFDVDEMAATHHAGFYQCALAQDVDAANLALVNTVPLLMGRLAQLNDPAVTGQRPFLSRGPSGSSGVMIVEYVAAAAAAELRACAEPASLGGAVLSLAAEEDATFAPQAVDQLLRATTAWRTLLASELLVTARLIRLDASLADLPSGLAPAAGLLDGLAVDDQDHDLEPYLDAAVRSLDSLAELIPR